MWDKLTSTKHLRFYEESIKSYEAQAHSVGEKMAGLMLGAVKYLQSLECANRLFGFTSMGAFQVTSAPKHGEDDHLFLHVSIDLESPSFYALYIRGIEQDWVDIRPE